MQSLGIQDIRACDPSAKARRQIAEQVTGLRLYEDYENGLKERPHTVLLCTPPQMHVAMAAQAIRAGCHVLCEKPISDTNEGIDELVALAAGQGKKIMVALCFGLNPSTYE